MSNKGLSGKEAAVLAAARRELAKPSAALPGANNVGRIAATPRAFAAVPCAPGATAVPAPLPGKVFPANAVTADAPPEPDISTHIAMLVEAERQAYENRKRRIKRNYVILVSAVMVPAFLYVFVTLFRLLAR